MGTVSPLRRFADGLANVLTGRGTTADRAAHNFWARRFTTPEQIESAYLGSWLHRKIVDIPAQDMCRAGRDWDAEDDEIAKIEAEEKRLGLWAKVYEALTLSRLGGGAILIGLGDDPSQPLPRTIRPQQIQYLTVLSRWQLTIGDCEMDPALPTFGQPRYFRLAGTARGIDIHPSRVVCFKGLPIPAIRVATWEDRFWGMSVVEAVDEAVQHATTACAGFASLIDEAKIDVFRFNGTVDQLSQPGGEEKLMKRVELTNTGKSVHRAVILDKEDEWEQRQLTLAGVRDVIITYDARVAGAADIPATRLFGKAPDGMNATGEGDLANYFQSIGAKQDMQLRPALQQIDAVMLPSAGVKPDLPWTFSTLMVLTEQQQAEIEAKEADTITKIAAVALMPESALAKTVQNRLIESGRWPGLKKLIEEAEAAGEEPGGDDLDIVPIPNGENGGDPKSGRNGGSGSRPASGALNDKEVGEAADLPFLDAKRRSKGQRLASNAAAAHFNATQPRDRSGRWIPTGRRDFIDAARAGKSAVHQLPIGKVSDVAAAKMASIGIPASGKSIALDASSVRHIHKRHGNERRGGHRSVAGADIASAAGILNGASGFRMLTPARTGAPRFATVTRSKGQRVYAIFEVRKRAVSLHTMWIKE